MRLAMAEFKVVLVVDVEGDDVFDTRASVVVVSAGVGMSRRAVERKAVKTLVNKKVKNLFHNFVKFTDLTGQSSKGL